MPDYEFFLRHPRGPQAFYGLKGTIELLRMCFFGRGRHRLLFALLASIVVHGILLVMFGNVSLKGSASSRKPFYVSLVQNESHEVQVSEFTQTQAKSDVPVEHTSSRGSVSKTASSERFPRAIDRNPASENAVTALPTSKQAPQTDGAKTIQAEPLTGVSFPGLAVPVKRVEIGFELFSGVDRRPVGGGTQSYLADHSGNFELNTVEKIGQENAPEKRWGMSIVGKVLKNGLLTSGFRAQGDLPDQLLALAPAEKSSNVSEDGRVRIGRMPDGILDRQSMLYQFMIRPPKLPNGKLMLADGKGYALFSYSLAGTEDFHLPTFGKVSAIKLVFSSEESHDVIELWLAPTLHFLPLKVRYSDKNGKILEQAVVSLEFD